MMTKEQFVEMLVRGGIDRDLVEDELRDRSWDTLCEVTTEVASQMPGIGFLSRTQRISAFIAVCRHLDDIVSTGRIADHGEAQLIISILRLQSKKFSKAIGMFDINANRFDPRTRASFPKTAIEYLAGLNLYGM